MRILYTADEARDYRKNLEHDGRSLGFVATMGALHEAHLALAHQSIQENDATLVSIFVNPTQFNNPEDLEKYPRRVEDDTAALREAGVTAVFLPSVGDIYGDQVSPDPIDLAGLDQGMEGTFRPGHFPGVATVIKRFFLLLRPHRAYFGTKDYQQLRVIQHMNEQEGTGVTVIGCETVRNSKGLAMSSRNYRLSEQGLEQALDIHHSIQWAQQHWSSWSPGGLKEQIVQQFQNSPLQLEYVEIADPQTMKPIKDWNQSKDARLFMAAFCEGVRLIDNDALF